MRKLFKMIFFKNQSYMSVFFVILFLIVINEIIFTISISAKACLQTILYYILHKIYFILYIYYIKIKIKMLYRISFKNY